jgi:hypothetical protein
VSTFTDIEVACPVCAAVEVRTVATSINVTRAPEYRDIILEGRFQRTTCQACGADFTPVVPFVYLDFGRSQYIGVYPETAEATWWEVEHEPAEAFDRNLGEHAPDPARPIGVGFRVRTVFGLTALREKIVALSAGLDDAVLETLKLRYMAVLDDLALDLRRRPRLIEASEDDLTFLVLDPDTDELTRMQLPRSAYDEVGDDEELTSTFGARLSEGPYRDTGRLLHRPA